MDAVKELDSLIEMMRDLLEMPGNPGYKTPEYREFHEKLTHFFFGIIWMRPRSGMLYIRI